MRLSEAIRAGAVASDDPFVAAYYAQTGRTQVIGARPDYGAMIGELKGMFPEASRVVAVARDGYEITGWGLLNLYTHPDSHRHVAFEGKYEFARVKLLSELLWDLAWHGL